MDQLNVLILKKILPTSPINNWRKVRRIYRRTHVTWDHATFSSSLVLLTSLIAVESRMDWNNVKRAKTGLPYSYAATICFTDKELNHNIKLTEDTGLTFGCGNVDMERTKETNRVSEKYMIDLKTISSPEWTLRYQGFAWALPYKRSDTNTRESRPRFACVPIFPLVAQLFPDFNYSSDLLFLISENLEDLRVWRGFEW